MEGWNRVGSVREYEGLGQGVGAGEEFKGLERSVVRAGGEWRVPWKSVEGCERRWSYKR